MYNIALRDALFNYDLNVSHPFSFVKSFFHDPKFFFSQSLCHYYNNELHKICHSSKLSSIPPSILAYHPDLKGKSGSDFL